MAIRTFLIVAKRVTNWVNGKGLGLDQAVANRVTNWVNGKSDSAVVLHRCINELPRG
jgi:hypothetical protein